MTTVITPPVCEVHLWHSPRPLRIVPHHIQPLGMGGPDVPANVVHVCDTGHFNIHRLIDDLLGDGTMRRAGTRKEHALAQQGYDAWVAAGKPGHPVYEVHDRPAPRGNPVKRRTAMLPLGKTDHVHDPRDLLMARYTAGMGVPVGPLGHRDLIPADGWGMLGNGPDPTVSPDFPGAGDCVFAGGDHETMLWNAERGRTVTFTGADSIADYSAVTGYDGTPATDRGTDMRQAMLYRKSTGLRDSTGKRHKITAFAALAAGDLNQVKQSIWLFSVAAVGVQFPTSAMDQFNAGKPWDVVRGSSIEGGHYVPVVGYDPAPDLFFCVTWGRLQPVTPRFLAKYMDEGFAPLSSEARKHGKTLEGFDYRQLRADLTAI